LLNSTTSGLARKFTGSSLQDFARFLFCTVFLLGMGIIFLYDIRFLKPLGKLTIVSCVVLALIGAIIFALRLDNWLYAAFRHRQEPAFDEEWYVPRVTMLATPLIHRKLDEWLGQCWSKGLYNADQFWQYSNLQGQIKEHLLAALSRYDERQLVENVIELMDKRYIWHLYDFVEQWSLPEMLFEDLSNQLNHLLQPSVTSKANQPKRRNRTFEFQVTSLTKQPATLQLKPHPVNQVQTCMSGFVYLQKGQLEDASVAFGKLGNSAYAREMKALVEAFLLLLSGENLVEQGPFLTLPARPANARRLQSWAALAKFHAMVHLAWLCRRCDLAGNRQTIRALFLAKLAEIRKIDLLEPERAVIEVIANDWQKQIEQWLTPVTTRSLKAMPIPFTYARPLRDNRLFIRRDREFEELKLAWSPNNLQPIMLYGQPLIGKTSLLYGCSAELASFMLVLLNVRLSRQTNSVVHHLLTDLCVEISQVVGLDRPSDSDLRRNAYRTCDRYIRYVAKLLDQKTLLIAIDEFENIAERFSEDLNLLYEWLSFLWHLQQTVDNLSFIFITTHPPDQLRCHLANPFANTAQIIHVSYPAKPDVVHFLQQPVADFIPQFSPDAVQLIIKLTNGQPYLVQLIGYTVVRRFNEQLLQGKSDPFFNEAMVQTAIHDNRFRQPCRRYFERLMAVINGSEPNMAALLYELAFRSSGAHVVLLKSRLHAKANLDPNTIDRLLKTLQHLDIVDQDQNELWRIKVELFRLWLAKRLNPRNI